MDSLNLLQKKLNSVISIITIILTISITQQWGNLTSTAQEFGPSPLEIPIKDPLLPSAKRPLSPFEERRLGEALDQLNAEAQAQFDAGNIDGAFEIWYRELRLRRFLGNLEEIQALGRVGAIAWDKSRTQDLKNINNRLILIQQQAEQKGPLTPELLEAFASAYQQLRKIDESLYIQQKILDNARLQGDLSAQIKALNTIGELHLSRFDYGKAIPIYEELLKIAQSQQDYYQEGIYLQRLAEIYSEALQPQNAVRIKEQLAENYLKNQQIQSIPDIKILIGQDYDALNQPEKASQNFQEAYSLAWAIQQYGAAGKALGQLGDLYRKYKDDDTALRIYSQLIIVEQKSYNYYGLMTAYDKIGKIYLENKNYQGAIAAFNQGLELAKAISYNQDYFVSQITQANQRKNGIEPTPTPTPAPNSPTPTPSAVPQPQKVPNNIKPNSTPTPAPSSVPNVIDPNDIDLDSIPLQDPSSIPNQFDPNEIDLDSIPLQDPSSIPNQFDPNNIDLDSIPLKDPSSIPNVIDPNNIDPNLIPIPESDSVLDEVLPKGL